MTTRVDTLKVHLETDGDGNVKASLAGVAQSADKVSQSTSGTAKAMGELTAANVASEGAFLKNSRAITSFQDLLDDLASGQLGRAKREVSALANETGLLTKLFNPLGITLLGVGGALAVVGAAALEDYDHLSKLRGALEATGGAIGVTVGQAKQLRDSLIDADTTAGEATSIVSQLALSGRFLGDALGDAARAAHDMAELTGISVDQAVGEIERLAEDPVRALKSLEDQYHFLTVPEAEEIARLVKLGNVAGAAAAGVRDLAKAEAQRLADMRAHETGAERYVQDFKGGASSILTGIESGLGSLIGDSTKQDVLNSVQTELDSYISHRSGQLQLQLINAMASGNAYSPSIGNGPQKEEAYVVQHINDLLAERKKLMEEINGQAKAAQQTAQQTAATTKQVDTVLESVAHKPKGERSAHAATDHTDTERQKALEEIRKEIDAEGQLRDMQAESAQQVQAFKDNLTQQLQIKQQQYALEVASVGMSSKEYAQAQQTLQIQQEAEQAQARLQKQYQEQRASLENSFAGKLDDPDAKEALAGRLALLKKTYAAQSAATAQYYAGDLAAAKSHFLELTQAQEDWKTGAIAAMKEWIVQGEDVAGMMAQTFTDAFGSMNDALVNFVNAGKLDFSDLAKSVISDLTRMELRIAESQILESLFGSVSGTAIAGNYMSGGGSSYAASGVSWDVNLAGHRDGGGPVAGGSLYEVAEGGKPEILTAAGHTYLLMGAQGGYVSPATRGDTQPAITGVGAAADGYAAASGKTTVIVENHSDSQAQVQQSKDASGGDIIKVIVGQAVSEVNKQIGRGGSTYKVLEQVFGLQRRGVPV
jgi:lambda family phage tail tape measure protein